MENVKQTGFINKGILPTDYRTGALSFIERLSTGDWRPFYPTNEQQFGATFDTMSCTTFSALNTIETQVNWMVKNGKMPKANLEALTALGFFDANGNFNCSDRFTAIMSNTTVNGNWFQAVWDCIRNDGILAEVHFPFGGTNFAEFHDKTKITDAMKAKALEAKKWLSFAYEFVTYDNDPKFTLDQRVACMQGLKQAPLQIAIPIPGSHAEMFGFMDDQHNYFFNTYPPYSETVDAEFPIHFALKGIVDVVSIVPRSLSFGMTGDDVQTLQENLKTLGYLKITTTTKYFGAMTKASVIAFQKDNHLNAEGVYGPLSRAAMAEALKKKLNNPQTYPQVSKLDAWALAIQEFEGWFPGSRSQKNCNPGNIKYVGQKTAIGQDDRGFCRFPDYKTGFEALKSLLTYASTKSTLYNPNGDLVAFFNVYAPSSDNNNPNTYANFVARKMGIPVTTIIKTLV